MNRYRLGSVSFEVPQSWEDQSVYIFRNSLGEGGPISFVVTRQKLSEPKTAKVYGQEQIREMTENLKSFKLLSLKESKNKTNVADAEFSWEDREGTVVRQSQKYVISGQEALIFTITVKDQDYNYYVKEIPKLLSTITI